MHLFENALLYSVQCTLYTMYTVHCALCNVQCIMYTVHVKCTVYIVHCTFYSIQWILYSIKMFKISLSTW